MSKINYLKLIKDADFKTLQLHLAEYVMSDPESIHVNNFMFKHKDDILLNYIQELKKLNKIAINTPFTLLGLYVFILLEFKSKITTDISGMENSEAIDIINNNLENSSEIMPQSLSKQKELDDFFKKSNVDAAIDNMFNEVLNHEEDERNDND